MNKFRFTIKVLAIAIFAFAFASMAQAQASRTWVSGVGDDANPCSRTAPCKTFAGAISKTATNGEIDVLDPGGFGAVTITKSMTIDGSGGPMASVLTSLGTTGILINAAGGAVSLRNLNLQGIATGGMGVRILAATQVNIERCIIENWANRGISDERTTAGGLNVTDTTVRSGAAAGIVVTGTGTIRASIDNCHVDGNSSGITVSGANQIMMVRNSTANGNATTGFNGDAGAHLTINNCQSSFNATGVASTGAGSVVLLSRTSVTHNTANGLGFAGGGLFSFGNNEVSANVGNSGPFTVGGPSLQ